MKALVERLKNKFPVLKETYQREDELFVTTDKNRAIDMVTYLRDYEGFDHLVLLTAVDWIEEGEFQLTYLLCNSEKKCDVGVRVMIPRDNPVMTSAHHLWEQIATYQRELFEMFGIEFPGSPRLKESFILEDWEGIPPYRRDFDTKKYSEETYFPRPGRETKDPTEHMKEKLYPEG